MAAAKASAEGIKAARERSFEVKALQDFHADIK
jgi:carbamoyl-phosphate synthase large subunit